MEVNIVTKDNMTRPGYGITNDSNNITDEDYFSYDYYDSVNSLPLGEIIPVTLVYSATFLVGVLGNTLVIFSIAHYRRLQTVTNIFLTSLASADLLLVVLCVPIQLAKWFAFTWQFGEALCKIVHYLQNMSVICSVLTLTAMSIERYYAIMHPMEAKFLCTVTRAKRVIIAVWILSITLSTPILYGQIHIEVGQDRKAFWCVKDWRSPLYSQIYEVCMLMLIFILPLIIITFAYINICVELWIMTSKRASMRAGVVRSDDQVEMSYVNDGKCVQGAIRLRRLRKPTSDDDRTRKQVIKMLVIVIFLFAICWGPLLIDNVLQAFGVVEDLNYGAVKHARQAFAVMAYANSCVNPVVYAFMSKNFRDSFRHAIFACCPRRARFLGARPMRQVSFQTHSTSVTMTTTTRVPSCRNEWDLEDGAEDEVNSDCPLDNKLSDKLESAM